MDLCCFIGAQQMGQSKCADEKTMKNSRKIDISDNIEPSEHQKAIASFRSTLDATRDWRMFTKNANHHNTVYWTIIVIVFSSAGIKRKDLIDKTIFYSGSSRTTVERAIKESKESGYIIDSNPGRETQFILSNKMIRHCINYYRKWMTADGLARMFRNLDEG
jgi:hypothetical protein